MVINITKQHLDDGLRADCFRCFAALAILDVLPGNRRDNSVKADYDYIQIVTPRHVKTYVTPSRLQSAMILFDHGRDISVLTSFELPIDELLKG